MSTTQPKCPVCDDAGFTIEPSMPHGEPVQVQCAQCFLTAPQPKSAVEPTPLQSWRTTHGTLVSAAEPECTHCTNGIVRSAGRDNDEVITDCPYCCSPVANALRTELEQTRAKLAAAEEHAEHVHNQLKASDALRVQLYNQERAQLASRRNAEQVTMDALTKRNQAEADRDSAREERDAAQNEAAALRADKARLDWLDGQREDDTAWSGDPSEEPHLLGHIWRIDGQFMDIRSAIDAAIAAKATIT